MKNILKYILCFAFCVGVICTTTTVNAEETEENIICDTVFDVGDTIIYKVSNNYNGYRQDGYAECLATSSNKYICFYLESGANSPTGYQLAILNNTHFDNLSMTITYVYDNGSTQYSHNNAVLNMRPYDYQIYSDAKSGNYFYTNIPIFQSRAAAQEYVNGNRDINTAINYKKTMDNGSWVRPFEDIEINDSDILVPDLSNISHEGFTVTNCNNDKYLIEIYMKSGFASPESGLSSVTTIDDALFVNNFGLITDNSEAYWNGPTINIAQLYGVDNISALTNSYTNFYTSYPSAKSYGIDASRDDTYIIWGNPFNKNTWFYTNNTEVDDSDLIGKSPYDFDLCFTNYRVRYFYYDDDSGYHYGPWCDVVYFSSGYITQSAIFQSNVGNIIETPITSGTQDSSGNINFNTSNIVDLNNPNELFGYLRSTINNINATGNTFMTLFATLFSFIPIELQIALWLGIACMIFIGVIKSI